MFGIGGAIKALVILISVAVIAGGLWYVSTLQADLAVAKLNEQKLTKAIETQKELFESMQRDMEQIRATNNELVAQAKEHDQRVKELTDKFNVNAKGESRDFGALSAAKPRLIERLVNRGTDNVLRCLEIATGAELTEKELNAKTASEINRECPEIANPNYIRTTP